MNQSILYVSAMIAFYSTITNGIQLIVMVLSAESNKSSIIGFGIVSVLFLGILGAVLYGRYLANGAYNKPDTPFNKADVLSTLGVIAMVSGLVWLTSEIGFVVEITRMTREIDRSVVERILPCIVLTSFGVYYGLIYKKRHAQQVDSAEASTIAVRPSDPSGSPR